MTMPPRSAASSSTDLMNTKFGSNFCKEIGIICPIPENIRPPEEVILRFKNVKAITHFYTYLIKYHIPHKVTNNQSYAKMKEEVEPEIYERYDPMIRKFFELSQDKQTKLQEKWIAIGHQLMDSVVFKNTQMLIDQVSLALASSPTPEEQLELERIQRATIQNQPPQTMLEAPIPNEQKSLSQPDILKSIFGEPSDSHNLLLDDSYMSNTLFGEIRDVNQETESAKLYPDLFPHIHTSLASSNMLNDADNIGHGSDIPVSANSEEYKQNALDTKPDHISCFDESTHQKNENTPTTPICGSGRRSYHSSYYTRSNKGHLDTHHAKRFKPETTLEDPDISTPGHSQSKQTHVPSGR